MLVETEKYFSMELYFVDSYLIRSFELAYENWYRRLAGVFEKQDWD